MQDHSVSEALLEAIDWIQRTGWPTRRADEAMACQIFDAWWDDMKASGDSLGAGRRASLSQELRRAFEARHGKAVADHLCTVFDAVFWAHAQSRRGANGHHPEAIKPSMPDDRSRRPSHLKRGGCFVPSTPTRVRLDVCFWIRVLIGLPLLASLIFLMATIGWWAQGAPVAFGPFHWLTEPLMPAGWAVMGVIITLLAIGTAVTACWTAFSLGTSVLGALQSWVVLRKRQPGKPAQK